MPSAGSRVDISRAELLGGVSGAANFHPGLPATFAGVAQSVEHLFCKQKVRGSSPLPSSNPKHSMYGDSRGASPKHLDSTQLVQSVHQQCFFRSGDTRMG
jgi:hypothetical protein